MLKGVFLLLLMIYRECASLKDIPSRYVKWNPAFLIHHGMSEEREGRPYSLHCTKKMIKKNQFHDRCVINVKGGNGGDGICCFTTYSQKKNKKYASGGRGGKGGDVYLIGDKKIDNFLYIKLKSFYYAGNGGKGCNNNQSGENGKDECINIPINTVIYDEQKQLINFVHLNNQKVLVSKGGKGGKGNYSYRTKSLKIPFVCQFGEKTKEKKIFLKKIYFTDFGIIGYPNVGKSTLLNKITNANVKIANYSYTSKFPNLGIFKSEHGSRQVRGHSAGGAHDGDARDEEARDGEERNEKERNEEERNEEERNEEERNEQESNEEERNEEERNEEERNEEERNEQERNEQESNEQEHNDETCEEHFNLEEDENGENATEVVSDAKNNYTVIDFPGIIKNLDKKTSNISYKYLEHLKFCRVLIYMFDINSNCVIETYENIKNVLVQYDSSFMCRKEVIILNKMDIYKEKDKEWVNSINELTNHLRETLKVDKIFCISALTGENVIESINEIILNIDHEDIINEFVQSLPKPIDISKIEDSDNFRPSDYEIHKYDENIYIIKGRYIENQANIFNFSKCDSAQVFNKILDDLNINIKLKNIGAKDGDKIIIGNYAYDFSLEDWQS
ncbi:GTP-binding protein, putative [Plasmodium ovale curtisi]|uniref:GTP-binding protein, putative n=1 Tax=Plasmodium ovale curtisi TaxID=864141 RepID=A0A1A8WZF8_PLAOA|nr:GTP-binding protein, putative [Plasmodium ovale curtisi]